jgi:GTP-binding protein HflX
VDVLLVSLREDVGEIQELIGAAGYHLAGEILQRRGQVHPRYFVGKGKLEEVKAFLERSPVGAVVFNGELKPSQHYALERELGAECFDRVRVILEIFTQRAHSREAKLQVELARLKYQIPFLREWIHQAEVGERPGFMAGGEYRVDAYYDTVKRRIKKISDDLEQIRREREARRAHRRRKGFHLVSLAGYTNAGKSSLLNALSGEHVLVEDRMFTTLSTTTRRLAGGEERILLTDTVGFIDAVPVWLIEAFRATLEEVYQADLILLVVDGSDPFEELERKLEVAARVMMPQVDRRRTLVAVSKLDLVPEERRPVLREILATSAFRQEGLWVSAVTGEGLAPLVQTVHSWFFPPVDLTVEIPLGDEAMRRLSWMHENAEVLTVEYSNPIRVSLRCDRGVQGILEGRGLRTRVLSPPPTPGS